MPLDTEPLVFDGHNDVLSRILLRENGDQTGFLDGGAGHITLPKAHAGGFGGGFFAIYVPSPGNREERQSAMRAATYDLPLPDPIDQATALPVAMAEAALLLRLDEQGALKICRTAADVRACLASGTMAAIMHIEGAEAIGPDLSELYVLYRAGLRSLGPVWSRRTIFAEGVPFRFPSDGDIGGGLTDAGKALVAECNRLGILVDLSHMNEAGFWDVAALSDKPLVATHSNAAAVCWSSRNLNDRQLAAIRESGGLVGLNFSVSFLRPDGRRDPAVGLDVVLRHLDHLIGALGEGGVGFGSDFDGATIPEGIGDASGLPNLRAALRDHGYDDTLIRKLCHENWCDVLERTWGQ